MSVVAMNPIVSFLALSGGLFAVAAVGTVSEDPRRLCFPESEYMNDFVKTVLRCGRARAVDAIDCVVI
jgi:hypothetical protein